MNLKFAHIRQKDERGNFLPGGFTIAYDLEKVDSEINRVYFTVAHCSPKDNFCKKLGRQIAQGRFDSSIGVLQLEVDANSDNGEIVNGCASFETQIWTRVQTQRAAAKLLKKTKAQG